MSLSVNIITILVLFMLQPEVIEISRYVWGNWNISVYFLVVFRDQPLKPYYDKGVYVFVVTAQGRVTSILSSSQWWQKRPPVADGDSKLISYLFMHYYFFCGDIPMFFLREYCCACSNCDRRYYHLRYIICCHPQMTLRSIPWTQKIWGWQWYHHHHQKKEIK